ncbi:ATP-binding cassette domain-containing protein [Billgrantia antri]|uniref:ATP-binding cassette domain-containing protein n=1 Tax=Halomonas sulfidivorans TaxID=2733488 RepID=A0ABX7WGM4_9GAMM|nr:ABC transporter ATP-binding protein [Halomonas sulfidivorans]QTP58662.1 ATP-binding cassette domain-containing protein [Halomonas sulfidivorans]
MSLTESLRLAGVGIGALNNIDLEVLPGEIVCLSGASGSGKSRLLRAVADLEPHEGEVWLGDQAQAQVPGHAWRRRVMLVPAESHWWAETVKQHFADEPADVELQALGFTRETLSWQVGRLSTGEKQRLGLLRAVSREPQVLLLDEPTANLDDATSACVEAWLSERIRSRGWPTLWVAHDRRQISRVASRHWRIVSGRLEEAEVAWA